MALHLRYEAENQQEPQLSQNHGQVNLPKPLEDIASSKTAFNHRSQHALQTGQVNQSIGAYYPGKSHKHQGFQSCRGLSSQARCK